jgi:hypothetical protein
MSFQPRYLTVPGPIHIGDRVIKRYHVNAADGPIEDAVVRAAEAFLPRLLPPEPDATPRASYIVLHRGRGSAAYLLAYSWVWDNVLEYHTAAAGEPFLGCPDRDPTSFVVLARPWVGCVWELPPLEHERSAWVRHMLAPDVADLAGYVADTLAPGPIGNATRSAARAS